MRTEQPELTSRQHTAIIIGYVLLWIGIPIGVIALIAWLI